MKGSTKLWISFGVIILIITLLLWGGVIVLFVGKHWLDILWVLGIAGVLLSTLALFGMGLDGERWDQIIEFHPWVVYTNPFGWGYLIYLGIGKLNTWADKHLGI